MSTLRQTCEVVGCGNPRYARSNYCHGHDSLRRWLRQGGTLEAFLQEHTRSDKNHGRPICTTDGCGYPQLQCGLCSRHYHEFLDKKYAYLPGDKKRHSTRPPKPLTDYSLPIDLQMPVNKRKMARAAARDLCCVEGCGKPRKLFCVFPNGSLNRSRFCEEHYVAPSAIQKPRGVCSVPGCGRPQDMKENRNGVKRWYKLCRHHRKPGQPTQYRVVKDAANAGVPKFIPINPLATDHCSICDWHGPCDKHRVKAGKDGGTYERGNLIVVCPNCHRLLHRGIDPRTRLPLKEDVA